MVENDVHEMARQGVPLRLLLYTTPFHFLSHSSSGIFRIFNPFNGSTNPPKHALSLKRFNMLSIWHMIRAKTTEQ